VPDEDRWLLAEMLREAERVADRILRMTEEQDDKSEQTIALGVAILGGGVGLAGLAAGRADLDGAALAALALAGSANLVALHRFLGAYVGARGASSLHLGPDPAWLAERARQPEWSARFHILAVLEGHASDIEVNRRAIANVVRRRRSGLQLLLFALGCYALCAFYIVGRGVAW
jgi:hypothetical protein